MGREERVKKEVAGDKEGGREEMRENFFIQ